MRQRSFSKWQRLAPITLFFLLGSSAVGQVPQISGPLVPSTTAPGSVVPTGPGLALTVHGTGFVAGSLVYWNGTPRVTTFVSSTSLMATITAEDVESPGTAWVSVFTPGVGASNVAYFEITNPTASVSLSTIDFATVGALGSAAVGDFNGDGKLDLAVTSGPVGAVSVLLGNGDGTFQPAVNYVFGTSPAWVTVGDFNGDGKLDLVSANIYENSVSVLLGNGDGTFQPAVSYGVGTYPDSVTVGDFNGDGKLDLAVANKCGAGPPACSYFTAGSVSVLLGNGDGTFQPGVPYGVNPWPGSVAVGDFNGDGKPDLAVGTGGTSNSLSVLLGNGDGTFQTPMNYVVGTIIAGTMRAGSVTVGDFNGDGKLDLADTHFDDDSTQVFVLLGNGDGTFQSPVGYSLGLPSSHPTSLTAGDLNGDGKLDLLVANASDTVKPVSVFMGNGDGTFQAAVNYSFGENSGSQSSVATIGDFNGDGRMDVAISSPNSGNVVIMLQPTPTLASGTAQLNGGNNFTGNQTVNGAVSATSFTGDGSGLTGIPFANTAGTANFATSAGTATTASNALSLGGILATNFARLDIGNTFTGNQGVNGNVAVSGNASTTGTLTIAGGTPITKHISVVSQNVAFNTKLGPASCVVWSAAIPAAADGDTVTVGLGNSLMSANIVYSAWAIAATVQVRICNPTGKPADLGTGNIRIDLWKH